MRNPVLGVPDQVRHKPGCKSTGHGYRLGISDLRRREIVDCTIDVEKENVLISMHIRAFGSAPFLFAQTVNIKLTDNGFITESRHEKPCLSGSRPGPTQTEQDG